MYYRMTTKVVGMISAIMLLGCTTSWKDTGSTVLTVSGKAVVGLDRAFISYVQEIVDTCAKDQACVSAVYLAAQGVDTLRAVWSAAYDMWKVENEQGFYNAAACLVDALRSVNLALSAIGFNSYQSAIESAINTGAALVASQGGVCK